MIIFMFKVIRLISYRVTRCCSWSGYTEKAQGKKKKMFPGTMYKKGKICLLRIIIQSRGVKSYRRTECYGTRRNRLLNLQSPCPDLSMAYCVIRSQLKSNTFRKAYPDSCCCLPTRRIASFELFQRMYSHLKIWF